MSHTTVPTLSSLLLGQIHAIYNSKKTKNSLEYNETDNDTSENEPSELGSIKLVLDKTGKLVENNEILDYYYHDEKLEFNFLQFCKRC